jgi:xylose isomerase
MLNQPFCQYCGFEKVHQSLRFARIERQVHCAHGVQHPGGRGDVHAQGFDREERRHRGSIAALIARLVNEECGGRNMGVAIDYGHEQMYGNEPADNLYTLKRVGVPVVNFHLNNAKTHSNDEDRVTGTGDNWRLTDFCFAAVDTGYQGWFGEDQFTYRMEPVRAMALSMELFANIMKKALLIYANKDKLDKARSTGDAGAVIEVVKKFLV